MEIIEGRHGNGSTLGTSQPPVDKWHDIIGEPTFAGRISFTMLIDSIGRPIHV
jgi:hypothetical protein